MIHLFPHVVANDGGMRLPRPPRDGDVLLVLEQGKQSFRLCLLADREADRSLLRGRLGGKASVWVFSGELEAWEYVSS